MWFAKSGWYHIMIPTKKRERRTPKCLKYGSSPRSQDRTRRRCRLQLTAECLPTPLISSTPIYTAIAPVPLSAFAGEPSQSVGKSFIKSYAAVCLEGAVIVLACIIFSLFASSPPVVNPDAAAVTMVWSYIGELVFNMLVLVGAVKMADRVVREMMGL